VLFGAGCCVLFGAGLRRLLFGGEFSRLAHRRRLFELVLFVLCWWLLFLSVAWSLVLLRQLLFGFWQWFAPAAVRRWFARSSCCLVVSPGWHTFGGCLSWCWLFVLCWWLLFFTVLWWLVLLRQLLLGFWQWFAPAAVRWWFAPAAVRW